MGFSPPTGRWLRGPLRDWAEAQLGEERLCRENLFDTDGLRRLWAEHLRGQRDRSPALWNFLMFQAWRESF